MVVVDFSRIYSLNYKFICHIRRTFKLRIDLKLFAKQKSIHKIMGLMTEKIILGSVKIYTTGRV